MLRFLSTDERERYQRHVFQHDHDIYLIAHPRLHSHRGYWHSESEPTEHRAGLSDVAVRASIACFLPAAAGGSCGLQAARTG